MALIAASFFIGFFLAALLYERELKRWAQAITLAPGGHRPSLLPKIPSKGWLALRESLENSSRAADARRQEQQAEGLDYLRGISALSHDMRTPLAGAKGYVQLAQAEISGPRSEASRRLSAAIRRIDDAEALMDQLSAFAWAKDPEREYQIDQVPLLPLVIDVLGGHESELVRKGWEPAVDFTDEAVCVAADPAALRRIVDNLVTNALKYGKGGLLIRQDRGSLWRLEVSNEVEPGSGFNPEKVFDRAWRAPNATKRPGLGLGLSIARSLARDMHLNLTAQLIGNRAVFVLAPGRD